jgi:hypothetical protein
MEIDDNLVLDIAGGRVGVSSGTLAPGCSPMSPTPPG